MEVVAMILGIDNIDSRRRIRARADAFIQIQNQCTKLAE
jgi:hypothetical protein